MAKKKLTLKEAVDLHYELWTWLAANPGNKMFWPRWKEIKSEYGEIWNGCFMCECVVQEIGVININIPFSCKYCPLDWTDGGKHSAICCSDRGLYFRWDTMKVKGDMEAASDIAYTIAELPLKDEYQERWEQEEKNA